MVFYNMLGTSKLHVCKYYNYGIEAISAVPSTGMALHLDLLKVRLLLDGGWVLILQEVPFASIVVTSLLTL